MFRKLGGKGRSFGHDRKVDKVGVFVGRLRTTVIVAQPIPK
jgi:hypothetical protein